MTAVAVRERMTLPSDQDSTGRTFGPEEVAAVAEALKSGVLTSTKGKFVKTLETQFAALNDAKHCHAVASGSAAVHAAIAALDPEPGDEIVTSPITDMGALSPIVYQGAIPVFADVDATTGNVTAETIAARLSDRTKAVVITHLFGRPCEMEAILKLAESRGIPVIEDCAQAFLATYDGKPVGTLGAMGCFSLQQGKHITTGEGGLVVTNDAKLARQVFLFLNKAWGYGDPNPDHYFLALNYRLSELQGAVAVAQLEKLEDVVLNRRRTANKFTEMIADVPGVSLPEETERAECVWWKFPILVDPNVINGGPVALGKALGGLGVASAPRYIQKPAFACQVFRDQKTFGKSRWPFNLARPEAVDYRSELFPGAYRYLERVLVLPWNEKYEDKHLDYLADSIRSAAASLVKE
jgi:perosamine synthetase